MRVAILHLKDSTQLVIPVIWGGIIESSQLVGVLWWEAAEMSALNL